MNILYVATAYPPSIGGAQRHLHALIRGVGDLGHQVRVAVLTQEYRRDFLRMTTVGAEDPGVTYHDGVQVQRLGLSVLGRAAMLPAFVGYYPTLGATLPLGVTPWRNQLGAFAEGADCIHAVRIGREFIYQAALEVARDRGIPFVLTPCHHPRWRGGLYRQWDRIYREADRLVALTEAEAELLRSEKGVPSDRIHVTGIGPLLDETVMAAAPEANDFRNDHGISGPFVLFLGQQLRYKGIEGVLRARRSLSDRFPDLCYAFVGPRTDYSRRLFRNADPRVFDLGPLSQSEKTRALRACELLCVPSSQESFGGVYVEAWSCGKPVVGLRTPQTASVVDHEKDGLLATDLDDVASRIAWLMEDPERRVRLGASGRQKVETRYTWPALVESTLRVYAAARSRDDR